MTDLERRRQKPLGAGDEIDAVCTKCGLELAHIIVAMEAARPVRVQCKTCKTVHGYRRAGGASGNSARKSPKEGGRRGGAIGSSAYDQVMKGRDMSRARPYKPALLYEVDDVVSHPAFGIGAVMKLLADNKLEAAFPSGIKVLVHGRS
jgi:hypothetical protein